MAELTSTPPAPNHEGETVVEFKAATADTQQTAVGEPPPALVNRARPSSPPATGIEKESSTAIIIAVAMTDDAARLSRAVQGHRGAFVSCFEQHVETVEGAPQLTVSFTVGEAGQVTRASVAPSSVAGTPLGSCVLSVARRIQFPALGREVSFSVPITAQVSR